MGTKHSKTPCEKYGPISPSGGIENASLNDVPPEVRRREAQKPLFLTRYE
ncbi:MAG: hypothetical protein NWE92_06870 [Candidatus Bathyarchaeota archaeon]|nr:hypothetical protein [Candidatus Bathyarchaeota archaeon]